MTMANRITITRILLIPVFVLLAVYYGQSVQEAEPREWLRYAAIIVFIIASASDGIDGYLARHYGQRTRLGAILDPIADKGLLITTIITLSVSQWRYAFPLWFPVLVITRDVVILTGYILLHIFHGHSEVRPTLIGKAATALQMVAIAWIMLQLPHFLWPVTIAGVATLLSGVGYVIDGIQRLHKEDEPNA